MTTTTAYHKEWAEQYEHFCTLLFVGYLNCTNKGGTLRYKQKNLTKYEQDF